MATELTQMPNSFCPGNCNLYEPEIKTQKSYVGDGVYSSEITLSCEYEIICRMWNEKYGKTTNGGK